MTSQHDYPTPLVLPCADPPAEVTFEVLDALDGSLLWVQEPLAHVYLYIGEEQLESLFVYLGDSILDHFTPPANVVLPPAALAAADAQAQREVHAMCEMIDFMLEPALEGTWDDVPDGSSLAVPTGKSVEPKFIWDDATQGGSADRAKLLAFALDPRNNLLVSRFDPTRASWEIDDPDLTYTIASFPEEFAVVVTAHRSRKEIARETYDAKDREMDPFAEPVGIAGLDGAAQARAIVRSCARAIRSGKLTRRTERTIEIKRKLPTLTKPSEKTDN